MNITSEACRLLSVFCCVYCLFGCVDVWSSVYNMTSNRGPTVEFESATMVLTYTSYMNICEMARSCSEDFAISTRGANTVLYHSSVINVICSIELMEINILILRMSHAMHIVVDRPIFLYTIPCFIEPLCRSLCFIHLSVRFVDLALSTVCAHLYVFGRWLS